MTDDLIPEIMYKELKHPTCPRCKEKLTEDEQGSWYCEQSPDCNYGENNNIGICQGECDELVLSPDMNFRKLEHMYCQKPWPDGGNCLMHAQAESDHWEEQDRQMREHIKHCQDDNCDCRNY